MKIEMKIGPTIVATDQPTMRNMTKATMKTTPTMTMMTSPGLWPNGVLEPQ